MTGRMHTFTIREVVWTAAFLLVTIFSCAAAQQPGVTQKRSTGNAKSGVSRATTKPPAKTPAPVSSQTTKAETEKPAAAKPATCDSCHAKIAEAHDGETRHAAMEMGCDSCHVAHGPGKPVADKANPKFLKKAVPDLCADCHDVQKRTADMKFRHAVADDCISCHSPHASANAKLLTQPQPALCETCHSKQAEAHQQHKGLHKPAFQDGCSTCHDPHATNVEHQLRADGNKLCLTCHAQKATGEPSSDGKTLSLFDKSVTVPGDYLKTVKRVALNSADTKGHPTATHPVAGVKDASANNKQMACVSCHDPHSSAASPQLFVTGKKSSSQLCIRCHQ